MIDLFKTYNKAKDVFVRPKIRVHFGLWRKSPGLPVWRRGPWLTLGKEGQFYRPNPTVSIKTNSAGDIRPDGTVVKYNEYNIKRHKLPPGCELGVWRRDIRKKLRKWGLGWLRPEYILPACFAFHIFNYDVLYKWKYDDVRYEFPPQFTIVFFGLSLTLTLKPQLEDEFDDDSHYWESLLSYLYQEECEKDIKKTLKYCGQWTSYKPGDNSYKTKHFQLRKTHIKPKYHKEYDDAVQEYCATNK